MKKFHLALQYLCVASGILALPFCAQLSRGSARLIGPALERFVKGRPLPAVTDLLITHQAQSSAIVIAALVAAATLGAMAIYCARFEETNSRRFTGLHLVTAVGYSSGLALLCSTLFASMLPFVTSISGM